MAQKNEGKRGLADLFEVNYYKATPYIRAIELVKFAFILLYLTIYFYWFIYKHTY